MPAPNDLASLVAAIKEVRRELSMRQRVYPDWIRRHKMTADDASTHWYNLKVAHDALVDMAVDKGLNDDTGAHLRLRKGASGYKGNHTVVFFEDGTIENRTIEV